MSEQDRGEPGSTMTDAAPQGAASSAPRPIEAPTGKWKPPQKRVPWWERKAPSALTFVVLLVVFALITVGLATRVQRALGDVGRDQAGVDPWTQPVGIERTKLGFLVAHIPECARGPVERIVLWDGNSRPMWEVTGPATPLATFTIGFAPEGFKTVVPYREPGRGQLVRLVVVRKLAGVAGARYVRKDLRLGVVTTRDGDTQHVYTTSGFDQLDFCTKNGTDDQREGSTIPSGVDD